MRCTARISNVLNHGYMFFFALRFSEAFWVIYLRSRGLSFAAIGLLETVYHIASFLAEIPTGIIADRIGRRYSLMIGRATCIVTAVLMLSVRNLPLLALTFAMWSLGGAFHSGAYEALVYDGLVEQGRSGSFTRVWGRLNGTYLAGASLAAVSGGVIAQATALRMLYYLSMGVDIIALAVLLFMREPAFHGHSAEGALGHLAESVRILRGSPRLAALLLFSGSLGACVATARMYGQSQMQLAGVPLSVIGFEATLANLAAIGPALVAHKIQDRLGTGLSLRLGVLAAGIPIALVGMVGIPHRWTGRVLLIIFLLLAGAAEECLYPIISDRMNAMIPSAQRATVLSANGMMYSICMIGVFPLFGVIGDRFGLWWGYLGLGTLVTAAGVMALGFWKAGRRLKKGAGAGTIPGETR